jgi:hypothetical protein
MPVLLVILSQIGAQRRSAKNPVPTAGEQGGILHYVSIPIRYIGTPFRMTSGAQLQEGAA